MKMIFHKFIAVLVPVITTTAGATYKGTNIANSKAQHRPKNYKSIQDWVAAFNTIKELPGGFNAPRVCSTGGNVMEGSGYPHINHIFTSSTINEHESSRRLVGFPPAQV